MPLSSTAHDALRLAHGTPMAFAFRATESGAEVTGGGWPVFRRQYRLDGVGTGRSNYGAVPLLRLAVQLVVTVDGAVLWRIARERQLAPGGPIERTVGCGRLPDFHAVRAWLDQDWPEWFMAASAAQRGAADQARAVIADALSGVITDRTAHAN